MLQLALGLVLFLGTHLFSRVRGVRSALIERFGEMNFKGVYSVLSLLGLVLVVKGYAAARDAGPLILYDPPIFMRHLVLLLMLPVFVLLAAAYLPGRIKKVAKHPMLLAVKIWATSHLLANGDAASVLLFGSFLIWGVLARVLLKRQEVAGPPAVDLSRAPLNDGLALVVGLALYAATVFKFHLYFIGVPVIG